MGYACELHQDHPGSYQMKSLSRSHLWWPGLDLDLEKLAKSCTACLTVKQAPAALCSSSPMGVAFQTLATFAYRFCRLIYGTNVPIGGGCTFQAGGGDRYGKVYKWHKFRGCSSTYFCGIWITRASSLRQWSAVHIRRVYEVSASEWGEAQPIVIIPSLIQ